MTEPGSPRRYGVVPPNEQAALAPEPTGRVVNPPRAPASEAETGQFSERPPRAPDDTQEFAEFPDSGMFQIPDSDLNPTTGNWTREERMVCSFPGLFKVLLPEASFQPINIAVRVLSLGAGTALIEVHDRSKIEGISLVNRFFELRVAHSDIPVLRGTVAWSDIRRPIPVLGLGLFERNQVLAQIVSSNVSALDPHISKGPPRLPTPILDTFQPVVENPHLTLAGVAPEATEVMIKTPDRKYTAKVEFDRFSVDIVLQPGENFLSLRSTAGKRRSRHVPMRIDLVNEAPKRMSFEADLGVNKSGFHTINVSFRGSASQAERILFRLGPPMAESDKVDFRFTLESFDPFDERLFNTLRAEGNLLEADKARNEIATRLLDDLL
jgi:hypothetical protein